MKFFKPTKRHSVYIKKNICKISEYECQSIFDDPRIETRIEAIDTKEENLLQHREKIKNTILISLKVQRADRQFSYFYLSITAKEFFGRCVAISTTTN